MTVCIAEKPSVAREIAAILGANTRKEGYIEGNGYAVTWTFGHFCTLKTPDDYTPLWKRWDLNGLPMLPKKFETKLISNAGAKKQFGVIKKLLKATKLVINCGDAGQEGELIQRWVLKEAGYSGQVQRLWISSLTAQAITAGFQNLKTAREFDNLYYAGYSRAIGDWLLGMNATRLYTLKYGGYKQLLSIGRVQTPTLAMIVARQKEIENFNPEPFWELHTIYRDVDFHYEEGRFKEKEKGDVLLKKIEGKPFHIISFVKKKGKEYPPRLFDLTSLQVHCNKRFGFSANQTLQYVQSLYEKKVVTYPRVDTTYLPNDIYPKVPGILQQLTNYNNFTTTLLQKPIRKSKKVFDDKKVTDHHAIIPTGVEKSLPVDEQKVYDAITRRFIAAFYPDCIVSNNTVIGEVEGVTFKATGKEILEEGWRALYPKSKKKVTDKKEEKNAEKILPNFVKGETGPHQPSLIEKITQAPKHYTEATLLRGMETAGKKVDDEELRELMKANGIGRPSTRANIIETLFKRLYIRRNKKQILATEMGVQLIDTIQNKLLKSAELTGHWEKKLREIEEGKHSAKQFIKEMKEMVSNLIDEVRMETGVARIAIAAAPTKTTRKPKSKTKTPKASLAVQLQQQSCPRCQLGKLLKGKTAYGCNRYQSGCDFRLPFKFLNKKIPDKQILRILEKGSTINLKGFKENGQNKEGLLRFNDAHSLVFEAKKVASKPASSINTDPNKETAPCPKCKMGQIVKGKTAYGCSNWKAGCDWRYAFTDLKKNAAGKKLTRSLVIELLSAV